MFGSYGIISNLSCGEIQYNTNNIIFFKEGGAEKNKNKNRYRRLFAVVTKR